MTPPTTPTEAPEAPQNPHPEPELQPGIILILEEPELDSWWDIKPPAPPAPPERPHDRRGRGGWGSKPPDWQRLALWGVMLLLAFLLCLVGKLWVYIDRGLDTPTG